MVRLEDEIYDRKTRKRINKRKKREEAQINLVCFDLMVDKAIYVTMNWAIEFLGRFL